MCKGIFDPTTTPTSGSSLWTYVDYNYKYYADKLITIWDHPYRYPSGVRSNRPRPITYSITIDISSEFRNTSTGHTCVSIMNYTDARGLDRANNTTTYYHYLNSIATLYSECSCLIQALETRWRF